MAKMEGARAPPRVSAAGRPASVRLKGGLTSTGIQFRVARDAGSKRPVSAVLSWRYPVVVAAIAGGYYAAAQGGEALLLTGPAGAFWPATGVGIAVLYLGGLRWWPGVLLGDLLSREFAQLPDAVAVAETVGNFARAMVAVLILLRLIGPRAAMNRLEHVAAVGVAVAVGAAISATVAMVSLTLGDVIQPSEMGAVWRSWWLGDISGGLVVVPLAMAWAYPRAFTVRKRRIVEGALMLAAVFGLSMVALSGEQPLTYIVFPALIWAALRFGPPGATVAVAIAAGIAVWSTANELGAFVEHSASDSALNLQLYITFAALTTLSLAAIVSERRAAAIELAHSRARIVAAGARERRRLEAELHDSAQNRLIALLVRLGLAREAAEEASPALVRTLDAVIEDAKAAGDELRRIAHGILPPLLASEGLAPALQAESLHTLIGVRVTDTGVGRSHPDLELLVYLCCLEAIQNAAKHAGPGASVAVSLRRENGELSFSVTDTGRGFDLAAVTTGAGLASVRDRIDTVRGRVDVVTAPGRGTTVAGAVPWPLRPQKRATPT
jgi:signal transduction histidine kinase